MVRLMEILEEEFEVTDSDGYTIGLLQLKQPENKEINTDPEIILFGSATAVKYHFYKKIGKYLAKHGFIVILFDYRGIGSSLGTSIRKIATTMAEWGSRDLQTVINWILETYSKQKIMYIGHSVGGQILGLLSDPDVFKKIVLVSAQIGYWRYYTKRKYWYAFLYYIAWNPIIRILGYMPTKRFGFGENLPRDMALQWCRWLKNKNYLFDDKSIDSSRYNQVKARILSYSFTDDTWAPLEAVQSMVDHYTSAEIEYRNYTPQDLGLEKIGHFGFFREQSKKTLWKEILEFFQEQ